MRMGSFMKSLKEAIGALRRDPTLSEQAIAGDLRVEVRVAERRTAADVFREVGAWEGESTDELLRHLDEERHGGMCRGPSAL